MSQITAEQLAQRIFDVGLLGTKELEAALQAAGGRGRATFDQFVFTLLEQEALTNWQIARLAEGHVQGFFYGNWQILYLIGHGTFARVYRALHRKTGDIKAVKVLRNRYSQDLVQREQFMREAKLVMKLRHPNIVPIHEVDEERGRIYMVMDFVEGQNLREYVRAHRRLNLLTSLKIVRDIGAGLEHAAQFNINHRDLKLSNVLLSAKGQAKLVDFGLAIMNDDKESGESGGQRSIDYAGLERVCGVRRDDPRSDIFFVGCMLYHMISGTPALEETRERSRRLSAQRYHEVKPINQLVPEIPHRVAILIHRLMDLDADKRIQTPAAIVQETDSVLKALEAGDNERFDAELAADQSADQESKQRDREEGLNKTVLIVESNVKLQDMLRERLKSRGYRVLIMADPIRALERFADLEPGETDRPADIVLFGTAGLGKIGIAAFAEFAKGKATGEIPAILLITENLKKRLPNDLLNDKRAWLQLPLKIRSLRAQMWTLLNLAESSVEPGKNAKLDAILNSDPDQT